MGNLMLKEFVFRSGSRVAIVALGSLFLASCSGSMTRFDYPAFGLSDSPSRGNSTASFGAGNRLGQGSNGLAGNGLADSGFDRPGQNSGLAEFGNQAAPDQGAYAPTSTRPTSGYRDPKSSYLPPQTAQSGRADSYRSAPSPQATPRPRPSHYDRAPMQPIERRAAQPRRSFLPSEPSNYDYAPPKRQAALPQQRTPANSQTPANRISARPDMPRPAASGDGARVTVAPGDTLYSIARRNRVTVIDLMNANEMSDSNISVGQQIMLPGKARAAARSITAKRTPKAAPTRQARTPRPSSSGTYTVRQGENFRAIAQKLGIDKTQLADVNGITDPGSIRPGEVLILPARRKPAGKTISRTVKKAGGLNVQSVKTRTIKLGAAKTTSGTAKPRKAVKRKPAKLSGFRWPVRGRIIGKFGQRSDGTHNDGINLAVPNGTKVKAAEGGTVAYAGSELKGYGNLVLIRHANNWVTAYAHNNKLMVKRGDKIKRGQVIARAGNSGSVKQPQVHFELRKGSKPVDPMQHMAGT